MANDDRDLVTVLKAELAFLENGGYRHSPSARVEAAVYLRGLADLHQPRQEKDSTALQRVQPDESGS